MARSLVEDDDAQMMKVSLGCSEMGLSSHLQAAKTGNTRFFTSNTHSSVVLQVSVCVIYICLLLNVGVGMWGVTICHSGIMSHVRVCLCVCSEETVKVISAVSGSQALVHT